MKKELFISKRKTSEKESGVEKYLFIGFVIVLLGVILVDTRFTGYQTKDDPVAGPGGYYHGQPPSAPMPPNDWAPYSYGSPQMPDMTPPYSTSMSPEMTYGPPQAPNMQAPTGMPEGPSGNPDMSFYMGPKCNEGEVFTTFPYYPDKNSFIYTRPNGEEIKISEFEAYTKCTKMKQKIGRCSLGDEWREGQWGTGCYPIPGVISDHTQPTYEGWESADCCAPKEKVECPSPDPNNPLEPVQWEACNPGAEDYSGLACCNTKQGYECVGDIGNKKCMEKPKKCEFGEGPEYVCGAKDPRASRTFGWCFSYDGNLLEIDEKEDAILPTLLKERRYRGGPKSISGCEDKEVCYCSSEFPAISCIRQGGLPTDFYLLGSQGRVLLSYANGRTEYLEDECLTNKFLERYGCNDGGEFAIRYSELCNEGYYCLDEAVCRRGFYCIDSDGGKDIYFPGETYIFEESTGRKYDLIKDICKSHTEVNLGIHQVVTELTEGYCNNEGRPVEEPFIECDCIPGTSVCIPPPVA